VNFKVFDKIWIHLGREKLSEVKKILAINFFESLKGKHIGPALRVMSKGFEHV
jgi:hypothetical protein